MKKKKIKQKKCKKCKKQIQRIFETAAKEDGEEVFMTVLNSF